jgi:hypothetical protein
MRTPTASRNRLAATFAVLLLTGLGAASCNLVLGLDKYDVDTGGDGGTACATDGDCDDGDACTVDTCGKDATCVHVAVPDGLAPEGAQVPFDCKRIACLAGMSREETDDTDTADDGNECTLDACSGGVARHTPVAAGTSCHDAKGSGQCDAQGVCQVACTKDLDCPAPADPCTPQICNTSIGTCVDDPVPDGIAVPGLAQTAGDCHVVICVSGVSTVSVDDTDLPESTTNDCVIPQCSGGVAQAPAKADGLPCHTLGPSHDADGYCVGGTCEECAVDANCSGSSDDCRWPACDPKAHACGVAHALAGKVTANPPQVASDCQVKQCDGNGNVVDVFDASDTLSDNNVCTTDTCKPGSPPTMTYPAVADGSTCSSGNGHSCVAGLCSGCTPSQTCQAAACVSTVLYKAATCSAAGACPSQVQQDCAPYKCATGGCPTSCTADTDCANTATRYCTGSAGAPGVCALKTTGGACSRAAMCASGNCVDGVCCNVPACGTCQLCTVKTSGQDGTCGAVPSGQDPKNNCTDAGAASCKNNGSCDGAGACQNYPPGTVCGNATCSSAANAYTAARTCNGTGTCSTPAPVSCAPYLCNGALSSCTTTCTSDAGCVAGDYCNSASHCVSKVSSGGFCSAGGSGHDCMSGVCGPNGICCGAACSTAGVCGATACAAGSGACVYPGSGTSCGSASCSGTTYRLPPSCNGAGTCSASTPSSCGAYACASSTACATSCPSNDAFGDTSCASGNYCDGMSCAPPQGTGAPCSRDVTCASGFCNGGNCN